MARSAAPVEITRPIAERAAQLARQNIRDRGWSQRAASAIVPVGREGQVGLRVNLDYLLYQNNGINPFIMWWVEGRTVPIKDASGVHFVYGKEPGQPGWVTLPGGVKKWRDQKWRHPGLKPKYFLENSLDQAISEARPGLTQKILDIVLSRNRISSFIEEGGAA